MNSTRKTVVCDLTRLEKKMKRKSACCHFHHHVKSCVCVKSCKKALLLSDTKASSTHLHTHKQERRFGVSNTTNKVGVFNQLIDYQFHFLKYMSPNSSFSMNIYICFICYWLKSTVRNRLQPMFVTFTDVSKSNFFSLSKHTVTLMWLQSVFVVDVVLVVIYLSVCLFCIDQQYKKTSVLIFESPHRTKAPNTNSVTLFKVWYLDLLILKYQSV